MRLPSTTGASLRARAKARRGNRNDDAGARPHIERHFRRQPFRERKNEFLDPRKEILTQPLDDITIRRQQLELTLPFHGLQRPHPGVELLFRELALEHSQTAVP